MPFERAMEIIHESSGFRSAFHCLYAEYSSDSYRSRAGDKKKADALLVAHGRPHASVVLVSITVADPFLRSSVKMYYQQMDVGVSDLASVAGERIL